MRGRGERIEALAAEPAGRLEGPARLCFKPGFEISTASAYARLAQRARDGYLPEAEAERRLAAWFGDASAAAEKILFNSFEHPTFERFIALPVLSDRVRIHVRTRPAPERKRQRLLCAPARVRRPSGG